MAEVVLTDAWKVYDDKTEAVKGLTLEIGDGELVVLVGPSGCVKTSALRMVAGLEEITRGTVRIGTQVVNDIHPGKRDIAMVFQNYALYPHMSVQDNIGFPLKLQRVRKKERAIRVARVARVLGLDAHLNKKPRQLSGGQRQRVAMGRAIIREPQVFLMDEPLSNLDAKLRVQMRGEIAALQRNLGVTTLYVTHDQVEAMTMGDRVAVMRRGELQQLGEPQTIYNDPCNLFVAGFIGSPPMNLIEASVSRADDDYWVCIGNQRIRIDDIELTRQPSLARHLDQPIVVGVRPERLEDVEVEAGPRDRTIEVRVTSREALGSDALVYFTVRGKSRLSKATMALAHDIEDPTEAEAVELDEPIGELVGRFDPRSAARPDQSARVAVKRGGLQFFHPVTGLAFARGDPSSPVEAFSLAADETP